MNNPPEAPAADSSPKTPAFISRLNDHLSIQEKINFARHLSLIIRAGLPIYEGLKILQKQPNKRTLKRVIDRIMADVNNGRFLSDSLENFRHIFGQFFINIIRVGEVSGNLAQNLLYLAEELKKSKDLESKIKSAMVYPVIILVLTIGVTAFLAFYILPKLLPILNGLNVELPLSTQILITSVNFIQQNGLWLLGGIVTVIFGFRFIHRKVMVIRYFFDWLIFFVPVIAPLVVAVNMVTMTRVLSMLLKSGIKIVEAIEITANTFDNLVYRKLLLRAEEEIRKGGQMATLLEQEPRYIPTIVSGMVQVGENTGNLEDNLMYISDYFNDEVESKLRNLTSFMEPILLLMMGLLVGYVAISIITPIYSMSQGVR
jgi:type IV pilus assembly protein PilC